jgi:outer membrane protein
MMRKLIIILGALMAVLLANAQTKWTLQQCVDTALANNRNIKQKELNRQTSQIAYEQARNNLLPNLNASASHNFQWGRALGDDNTYTNSTSLTQSTNFGLSSSLTLFDGLKMKYNIDARLADLKTAEANKQLIERDIIMSVSTAFLQVLLNKELLQVAENQLSLTNSKIDQQKKMIESGKLAEGELLELQAQAAKEELSRIQTDNNLKLALLDIAQIMELKNFEGLDVEVPANLINAELQLLNADEVYKSALNGRPEIKAAEYALQSSETNVRISKSGLYPSLSMDASLGSGYYKNQIIPSDGFGKQLSDKIGAGIGFSLRIPIFNKFETKNQIRSSELEVEKSKLQLDNTKIELQKNIQQAYYNAIGARAKWESALKSQQANTEAYRFANQKYEGGRSTVYELYQAKNNLAQAQSEVIQAKYEYVFRLKILELMK